MVKSPPLSVLLTFCVVIVVFVFLFYIFESQDKLIRVDSESAHFDKKLQTCHPNFAARSTPILVNIETKLGVNYVAGHWFHMAEMIMTRHAELRAKKQLFNSTEVYYNFEKDGFVLNLNSITRFIVYLGTIAPGTKLDTIHFLSSRSLYEHTKHVNAPMNMLLDASFVPKSDQQSILLANNMDATKRFAIVPSKPIEKKASPVCVQYVGRLKSRWPTPQRGSWFPHEEDIIDFRQKIRDACPADEALLRQVRKKKAYKLIIYQRDFSRKLAEEEVAVQQLRLALPEDNWEISVLMHSSQRSPCEFSHILHDVDVLVTPHGFQSMLLLFMPRPSVLFELFPYRYWKRGYGPLSKEYGIIHTGVMSPATKWSAKVLLKFIHTKTCMNSKRCRGFARNQDVLLTRHGVNRLVHTINSEFKPALENVKEKRDFLYK